MKQGNYTKNPMDWKDAISVLNSIKDPEYKLFFALMLMCGMRAGEIVKVRVKDLDGERVMVWKTKVRGGKKYRTVVKPPLLQAVIDECLPKLALNSEDYVFRSRHCTSYGSPLHVNGVNWRIKEILGDPDASGHTLRKTAALRLYLASNKDISIVQKFLDHTSPASTVCYLGLTQEKVDGAVIDAFQL